MSLHIAPQGHYCAPIYIIHNLFALCEFLSYALLTLGAHVQRGLQYLVCVSVCVSVTQHLTFHMFIRATNDTNLLGGG